MMTPHRVRIREARKVYSECAGKLEKIIEDSEYQEYTVSLSNKLIGIGVAAEWLRYATEMDSIHYIGEKLNKSKKSRLFIELLRFNFSWFALNAIFTRNDSLSLFGTPFLLITLNTQHFLFCTLMRYH